MSGLGIDQVTAVPKLTDRLGSASWAHFASYVAHPESAVGDFIQGIGMRDFFWFGAYRGLENTSTVPMLVFRDSDNFLQIKNRGIFDETELQFDWEQAGTRITAAADYPAVGSTLYDSAMRFFAWRQGNNLRVAFLDRNASNPYTESPAVDCTGYDWDTTLGTTAFARISSTTSHGHYQHMAICDVGPGNTLADFGLDQESERVKLMRDHQRIRRIMPAGARLVSYGDLQEADGTPIRPTTSVRNIITGDKLVCPFTGHSMAFAVTTTSPLAFPPYTDPNRYANQIGSHGPAYTPLVIQSSRGGIVKPSFGRDSTVVPAICLDVFDPKTLQRCRPPIAIIPHGNFIDSSMGDAQGLKRSWSGLSSSAFDNHVGYGILEVGDELQILQSAHSSTLPNEPETGDRWLCHDHVLFVRDDQVEADVVFVAPEETTWGIPLDPVNHYNLLNTYFHGCVVGAYGVIQTRQRDTTAGSQTVKQIRDGVIDWQRITNQDGGGAMQGALPTATVPLLGDRFLVLFSPRLDGSTGRVADYGVIGKVGSAFTDKSKWHSARTGEVLDGTGPNALTLGTITTDDENFFIHAENRGSPPVADMDDVWTPSTLGDGKKRVVTLTTIGLGNLDYSHASGKRHFDRLYLRCFEFDPAKNLLTLVREFDLLPFMITDLGDPDAVVNTSYTLQWVDPGRTEAVLIYRAINGAGAPTAWEDQDGVRFAQGFANSHGDQLRGLYFADLFGAPETFEKLGPIIDCGDGTRGLSVQTKDFGTKSDFSTLLFCEIVSRVETTGIATVTPTFVDLVNFIPRKGGRKSKTLIWDQQSVAAAATLTSAAVDTSAAYGALVYRKSATGSTPPTTEQNIYTEASPDGTRWYRLTDPHGSGTAADTVKTTVQSLPKNLLGNAKQLRLVATDQVGGSATIVYADVSLLNSQE
ncbi:MAG: hypothetical protein V3U03_17430 [Myxococcota bacterium]